LDKAKNPNRRLDSWKEIASFFRRDERTVKRWEKERGLPVHRMQGSPKGRVYAFTDELSRWMNSPTSASALDQEPTTPAPGPSQTGAASPVTPEQGSTNLRRRASDQLRPARKRWLFGTLAVAALLGTAGGFLYYRQASLHTAPRDTSEAKPLAGHAANPEAQDFYLKGRYEWDKRTPESLNKAVDYFTQAIVRDPNYAQAYVGLADCYNLLREFSAMPADEAYPRALAAAKKAVELDDSSAEAHTSLAFATFYGTFDAAGAEREFKRAIELNPNYARAHHWYATFLLPVGRYPEALQQIEMARQLDPASTAIVADQGLILLYAGPREQGISLLKQLQATDPAFPSTYRYLQHAYLMDEDYRAYLAAWEKAAQLTHDQTELAVVKAGRQGFSSGGREGMWESVLQKQLELYRQGDLSPFTLALTYSLLCRKPEALKYLQIAYQQHDAALVGIRDEATFGCLYKEPAFQKLLAQVGLLPVQ
jgi:Tfp pilus assembly protein PilF